MQAIGMPIGLDRLPAPSSCVEIFGFVEVGEEEKEHHAV